MRLFHVSANKRENGSSGNVSKVTKNENHRVDHYGKKIILIKKTQTNPQKNPTSIKEKTKTN